MPNRSKIALTGMVLGPPLLLLAFMHFYNELIGPPWRAGDLTMVVMAVAVLIGLTALAMSGWSRRAKLWTAIGYVAGAVPLAPAMTLMAQCTTGDCI